MNFELQTPQLVGKTFDCECGKSHSVPVQMIEISNGALRSIPGFVNSKKLGSSALLVADRNTWRAAGETVETILTDVGIRTRRSIFPTSEPMHADEAAIFRVLADFDPELDFLVAIGSGTINDLTKFVAYKVGRPYIVCATAPSMDGYTSTVSPLTVSGFKKTFYVGCPVGVFADLNILAKAPDNLVVSGVGDLVGKITAGADWMLSKAVTGEYHCPRISGMMRTAVETCMSNVQGISERTPEGMAILTDGLLLSGLAMLMAGSSRPASGAEHLAAHYWEIKNSVRAPRWDLHGARVGVATLLVMDFCRRLFDVDFSRLNVASLRRRFWTPEKRRELVAKNYGSMADQASEEASVKYVDWEQRLERLDAIKSRWDVMKSQVSEWIERGSGVEATLRTVGAPLLASELGIESSQLRESLMMCKEMRGRYTVFDLGEELGILEDWVQEIQSNDVGGTQSG